MTLAQRINLLASLGEHIEAHLQDIWQSPIAHAIMANGWFTKESIELSLVSIAQSYLDRDLLEAWVAGHTLPDKITGKKIGLVLAGNIPLVGWHDIQSAFISGHISMIKYSHKDEVLPRKMIDIMQQIDPRCAPYFAEVDRLSGMNAVIATGGDTASTHFQYYFKKYPHIIRKNRSSLALLTSATTQQDLKNLGADIFNYFGLGCRSVSKLYIPEDFKIDRFFEAIQDYKSVIDHNKYKNNYDYTYSIFLLGQTPFLTNNFINLIESPQLSSRIACLHYERYNSLESTVSTIKKNLDQIQCIVGPKDIDLGPATIPYGDAQVPGLTDYADGIDTLDFLTNLQD